MPLVLAKAFECYIMSYYHFCWHMGYDFLKEDHNSDFLTKNSEDLMRHFEDKGRIGSNLTILVKMWNF